MGGEFAVVPRLLPVLITILIGLTSTPIWGSSSDTSISIDRFVSTSTLNVGDWNVTIIWFSVKPDLVIEYCGRNIIYYKPYELLMVKEVTGDWLEDVERAVLIKMGISRYAGENVNFSDPISVAKENERRYNVAAIFDEVFEKAGGKALGLRGLNFRFFHGWEPPVLIMIMYFGDKSLKEKEDIMRELLQNPIVLNLLKSYNVRYIIVREAYSMGGGLAKAVGDLLFIKVNTGEVQVPESIKDIIRAPKIIGGMGPFGAAGIGINATVPDKTIIEEFVRWIRDNVKQCDEALVITFNDPIPGLPMIRLPGVPTTRSLNEIDESVAEGSNLTMLAPVLALIVLLVLTILIYRGGGRINF